MISIAAVVLTGHLFTPHATKVDFRLMTPVGAAGQPAATAPSTPESRVQATERVDQSSPTPARPPPAAAVLPQAQGFGNDIPLDFAARQIVPSGMRVVYGPGVNPDEQVSWAGGKPWNRVLQDAIRPLQLRMTLARNTVTITR